MNKCKYPNEICANMTWLYGETYCSSVPCSLNSELPKQTNADRIRAMSDKELAEFLVNFQNTFGEEYEGEMSCLDWLQSEAE